MTLFEVSIATTCDPVDKYELFETLIDALNFCQNVIQKDSGTKVLDIERQVYSAGNISSIRRYCPHQFFGETEKRRADFLQTIPPPRDRGLF